MWGIPTRAHAEAYRVVHLYALHVAEHAVENDLLVILNEKGVGEVAYRFVLRIFV